MTSRALPHGMTTPVVLLLVAVVVLPEIAALALSFQQYTYGQAARWIGAENYTRLWSDPAFWSALRNNVLFVVAAVVLELAVGLAMAVVLAQGFPLQRLWVALYLAPYAVSPVVGVVTWKYMLEPDVGLVNYALGRVGIASPAWFSDPWLALSAVILIEVWRYAPFVAMVCYPAILSLPADYFDAARVDGAGPWQTFVRVTVPLIRPALLVAVVFRVIFALRTFDTIWILTKGGPVGGTEVLATYLYQQGFRYWELGAAAATAWVMLGVTTMAAAWYFVALRRAAADAR
jgi:ABC-type sugar transport system permease subunit